MFLTRGKSFWCAAGWYRYFYTEIAHTDQVAPENTAFVLHYVASSLITVIWLLTAKLWNATSGMLMNGGSFFVIKVASSLVAERTV